MKTGCVGRRDGLNEGLSVTGLAVGSPGRGDGASVGFCEGFGVGKRVGSRVGFGMGGAAPTTL